MVSEPNDWRVFPSNLEDMKNLKASFTYSVLIRIPRTQNKTADKLAEGARKQLLFIVHMDI